MTLPGAVDYIAYSMPSSATSTARDIACWLQPQNSLEIVVTWWEPLHRRHVLRMSCSLPGHSSHPISGQCEVIKVWPLALKWDNFEGTPSSRLFCGTAEASGITASKINFSHCPHTLKVLSLGGLLNKIFSSLPLRKILRSMGWFFPPPEVNWFTVISLYSSHHFPLTSQWFLFLSLPVAACCSRKTKAVLFLAFYSYPKEHSGPFLWV